MNSVVKILFTLTLLNSIGGNALWLSAGPFLSNKTQGIGFIGLIAASRQISFLFGSILGGIHADSSSPLRRYFAAELGMLCLSLGLLYSLDNPEASIFIIWACLRFFLSGYASNLSFKVFGECLKSWSWGNTVSLLFIQGSFFFSAILALVYPHILKNYFLMAVIVDLVTSLILVIFLRFAFQSSLDIRYSLPRRSFRDDLSDSMMSSFSRETKDISIIRTALLVATSGMLIFSIQLSKVVMGQDYKNFFFLFFLIYGSNAWAASLILKKLNNNKLILKLSLYTLIFSCLIFLINSGAFIYIGVFFFTLAYWLGVLSSNQLVLQNANSMNSGKISSSLIFQISIIFGIGELLYGLFGEQISISTSIHFRIIITIMALIYFKKIK